MLAIDAVMLPIVVSAEQIASLLKKDVRDLAVGIATKSAHAIPDEYVQAMAAIVGIGHEITRWLGPENTLEAALTKTRQILRYLAAVGALERAACAVRDNAERIAQQDNEVERAIKAHDKELALVEEKLQSFRVG